MRNRAKCRLCGDVIESFHQHDYVRCSCDQIAVDGGNHYHKCEAVDWVNFIRIDDEGNEILPKIVDQIADARKPIDTVISEPPPLSRDEKMMMLKQMADSYDRLPQSAMMVSPTNYDMHALIILLHSILKEIDLNGK
ncbi:MAG: hypothetical protein KGI54_09565 [Pseudomonadota bacterium]|nr:hypothetical protein [Pseudomonadota bacterium]